ncbi:hypothetical protein PR202_gb08101 [Eleusine coracana subsp. coracana]|uniref:Uncharacterized protein n=1 Tax=Eleusine coracana subsp. coracana TaxID=191504 RepID=A0AAV5EEP5_ELECO|nr:hypothetical protein PR202_gb08101 [Eleusine coracana subsp. coracana]
MPEVTSYSAVEEDKARRRAPFGRRAKTRQRPELSVSARRKPSELEGYHAWIAFFIALPLPDRRIRARVTTKPPGGRP